MTGENGALYIAKWVVRLGMLFGELIVDHAQEQSTLRGVSATMVF
jgi:hypothetical protein